MIRTTKKRAYVETYGCQMNISDGELMEGLLEDGGYEIVSSPEQADVVLVNTCAIREHAEKRVLGRVGQLQGLKKDRPDLILGVTGCMAQRMGHGNTPSSRGGNRAQCRLASLLAAPYQPRLGPPCCLRLRPPPSCCL